MDADVVKPDVASRAGALVQRADEDRGVAVCPTLYQWVANNLATLYGAVDHGAFAIAPPRFVKNELEGYLECALLCRGFARLRCELLRRTFGFDVLACPRCEGRMRLLGMVTDPKSVARYLRARGEPTEASARAPARGPPFWKSLVLRRAASDDHAAE